MAFSWTPVVAGQTKATAAQINEVRTNTDMLASNLGISLTWNHLPVSPGDKQTVDQALEVQDNLDFVDASNVCSANNVVEYIADNANYNATVQATHNSTVDNDQHATYDNDQNTGINVDRNTTIYTDLHGTYDNNQNTGYNNDVNGTIYGTRNASAK